MLFVQLHMELDGELSLRHAHDIAVAAGERIKAEFEHVEVIIHQDPV